MNGKINKYFQHCILVAWLMGTGLGIKWFLASVVRVLPAGGAQDPLVKVLEGSGYETSLSGQGWKLSRLLKPGSAAFDSSRVSSPGL